MVKKVVVVAVVKEMQEALREVLVLIGTREEKDVETFVHVYAPKRNSLQKSYNESSCE